MLGFIDRKIRKGRIFASFFFLLFGLMSINCKDRFDQAKLLL